MPPVLIPVGIALASSAVAVGAGVTTIAAAAITVGTTALAAGVGYIMSPKPDKLTPIDSSTTGDIDVGGAPFNAQRDVLVRQAVAPRRYVYGLCRLGGVVFFQDNDNPYLYVGVALSDGVMDAVLATYFADELIPVDGGGNAASGSRHSGFYTQEVTLGLTTQTSSPMLAAAFPAQAGAEFRQRGVARVVCRLHWGDDASVHNALWGDTVSPTFLARGVRVYDSANPLHSPTDETTWDYSASPPLCLGHALTHAWGVALAHTDIDWPSFQVARTVCAAQMTYNSQTVTTFEMAGVFQAGHSLASQITDMLASFGGALIDVDGKLGLVVDGARTAVWTITDDDIVEFGEFVHAGDYADTFNAVKAHYFDALSDGKEATTPVYEIAAAVTADGLRETSIDLSFVPATHSAQILAYRELQRSRAGKRLSLTLSDAALFLAVLDRVAVTSTDASFVNGDYEVVQVELAQFGAVVHLREYPTAAYADPSTYLV